jgi:hypothetical protein
MVARRDAYRALVQKPEWKILGRAMCVVDGRKTLKEVGWKGMD